MKNSITHSIRYRVVAELVEHVFLSSARLFERESRDTIESGREASSFLLLYNVSSRFHYFRSVADTKEKRSENIVAGGITTLIAVDAIDPDGILNLIERRRFLPIKIPRFYRGYFARLLARRERAFDFQLAGKFFRDTACAAIFRVKVYGLRVARAVPSRMLRTSRAEWMYIKN